MSVKVPDLYTSADAPRIWQAPTCSESLIYVHQLLSVFGGVNVLWQLRLHYITVYM